MNILLFIFLIFNLFSFNKAEKTPTPFIEHIIRITFLKGIMSGMCQEELNLFQTEDDKGFGKILDEDVRNEFRMAFRMFEEEKRDIKVWINTIRVLLKKSEYEENNGE
ncbi:unnamed protein product [Meloidogyne enterolobii]|uniref:Uncharacterized protein n=1 Tax=Meloidogyne enterolobii TaxID=390850 RepID=A0ACB0Y651_MELEN